ncbi:MAG: haloacid dehalogenase type II [Gemmatimonadaceae bacterium]
MDRPLCVFDAYGTLFDLTSVLDVGAAALGSAGPAVLATWRQKQLEYTWLRTIMGRYAPFDRVTDDALHFALRAHGVEDEALRRSLMDRMLRVSPYPDVAPLLQRLRGAGFACAILSNGTAAMLHSLVEANAFGPLLEHVWSADTVRCFKPDARVYAMASDDRDVPRAAVTFVSANAWDAAGAADFGLRTFWLNRAGGHPDLLGGQPPTPVRSLTAFGDVLLAARRG